MGCFVDALPFVAGPPLRRVQIWLEMEIGITGGEEDGVDNSGMDQNKLYTQPEQVRLDGSVSVPRGGRGVFFACFFVGT